MQLKKSAPTKSHEFHGYRITHHRYLPRRVIRVLGEHTEARREERCYVEVGVSGFTSILRTPCDARDGIDITLVEFLPRVFPNRRPRDAFLIDRHVSADKLRRQMTELKSQGMRAYVSSPWLHDSWFVAAYALILVAGLFHGAKNGFESLRSWEFVVPGVAVAVTFLAVRAYRWWRRREHLLQAASSFSFIMKSGMPSRPLPAGPPMPVDKLIQAQIAPLTVCDGTVDQVKIEKRNVGTWDTRIEHYFVDLDIQGNKWVGESASIPMIAVGDRLRIIGNRYSSEHGYVFAYRNYTDGHTLKAVHPADATLGFPQFNFSLFVLLPFGVGALLSALMLTAWMVAVVLVGHTDATLVDWLGETVPVLGVTFAFSAVFVVSLLLFDKSQWFWRNYRKKRLLRNLLGCRTWKEWWDYSESGA